MREFSIKKLGSCIVFLRGAFARGKSAQVQLHAVRLNCGCPVTTIRIDALEPVGAARFSVSQVLCVRPDSQVLSAIVERVTVAMVRFSRIVGGKSKNYPGHAYPIRSAGGPFLFRGDVPANACF